LSCAAKEERSRYRREVPLSLSFEPNGLVNALIRSSLLTAIALVIPATLIAQEPVPQQQPELDPELEALVTEMQEIQQRLAPIQQQAMQDPELMAQYQQVQEQVEGAMREEDPTLFTRVEELQEGMQAAQEAGDEEQLQTLAMQAQGIQQEIQTVQEAAISRPDVRQSVEAFEGASRAKMVEIDPEADTLLERAEELQVKLAEAMGQYQPQQ